MKIAFVCLATLILSACAPGGDADTRRYPASLTEPTALDDAPRCDVETACPDDLDCVFIEALEEAVCLDDPCSQLECAPDDSCVILESYPAQVMCEVSGDLDGGDEPVES